MYQGTTGRLPAESPRPGRPAGWETPLAPGRCRSAPMPCSPRWWKGCQPSKLQRGDRRPCETRVGEQKHDVTDVGNTHDLLVRSEDTGTTRWSEPATSERKRTALA